MLKTLKQRIDFRYLKKPPFSEFTVWIDGQPVVGEVLKKEEAQKACWQDYED